jgi:hypothetical protein
MAPIVLEVTYIVKGAPRGLSGVLFGEKEQTIELASVLPIL